MGLISYDICSLDTNNQSEVALYERILYRAFLPSLTNTSHLIFSIDHKEKRLATKIPYTSQVILVLKWDTAIVGGFAVNFDMENTLQLELLNFHIESRKNVCEALVVFSVLDFMNSIPLMRKLGELCISEIKKKHRTTVFATSSQRRSAAYTLLGFQIVDSYTFEGQVKCLLQMAI
jgi:hypothetical protein